MLDNKNNIKIAIADRGHRGKTKINEIEVKTPKPFNNKTMTKYKQKKLKAKFGRRAAIESIIGHLKRDHRLGLNFYKGLIGDSINVMLAAAAFNFKRMMRKWKASFLFYFFKSIFKELYKKILPHLFPKPFQWLFKERLFLFR